MLVWDGSVLISSLPLLVCLHVSVSQAVIAEQLTRSIQWTLQWK